MAGSTIAALLRETGIDQIDARALLRTVLAVNDAYLVGHGHDALKPCEQAQFHSLVERRRAGEPVAYLTGEREFYGRMFNVTPAVLIPRPETELLVDLALEHLPQHQPRRVLDLGTGSGCIAVSVALERPQTHVIAVDRSPEALQVARENARQLAVRNVEFRESDWFSTVREQCFDVIASNPPYVAAGDAHLAQGDLRFEPQAALVAGTDGLDCICAIAAGAQMRLAPGGWLLFEHGYDQAQYCRTLLMKTGFVDVQSWHDLAGIERVTGGRRPAVDPIG